MANENTIICPKCHNPMEEGYLYGAPGVGKAAKWGESQGLFTGIKNPREIKSFRCTACGYLENYSK